MDSISALMGLEAPEDEKMRMLADRLRGEQQAGQIFSMSQIPGIGDAAAQHVQDVNASAQQAGLARAKELDRQAADERARIMAAAQKERADKPPSNIMQAFQNNLKMQNKVNRMNTLYKSMDKKQRNAVDSAFQSYAYNVLDNVPLLPEGTGRVAGEHLTYKDPKVKEYMKLGFRMQDEVAHALFGAALTRYEIKNRDRWSWMAPGISQEARQVSLDTLMDDLRGEQQLFAAQYPNYFLSAVQAYKASDDFGEAAYGELASDDPSDDPQSLGDFKTVAEFREHVASQPADVAEQLVEQYRNGVIKIGQGTPAPETERPTPSHYQRLENVMTANKGRPTLERAAGVSDIIKRMVSEAQQKGLQINQQQIRQQAADEWNRLQSDAR
jgi:hypothetical protein